MKNTTKYLIEVELPDGLDQSTLLEAAQEFAVDLFEQHSDDESNPDFDDEEVRNAVSVQEVAHEGTLLAEVIAFEKDVPVETREEPDGYPGD